MNMLGNEARLPGPPMPHCPLPERYLLEVGDLLHGHLLLFLDSVTHGLLHALQQEVKGSGILVQTTERTQVRREPAPALRSLPQERHRPRSGRSGES